MAQLMANVQGKLKTSSSSFFTYVFKVFSGSTLGLTLALIGQEIIGYETLSFSFVIVAITAAFLKVAKRWNFVGVLIFDLICVLIGMLLRMYILIAPGA